MRIFRDRRDAGRQLADALLAHRGADAVVLGLPRGGVPVAFEIAVRLGAPLDVIIVRKLGLRGQPELAMGAIGEGETMVLNDAVVHGARVSRDELESVAAVERAELDRLVAQLRGPSPRVQLAGRTAIIVDDGVATGATARVACQVARQQGARAVTLATPIGSTRTVDALLDVADDVVCLRTPRSFRAVGQGYVDFSAVPDAEVIRLIALARDQSDSAGPA